QYALLKLLAGGHNNACIVGDDDQSIYSWRGARVDNFAAFTRDFTGVKAIRLEQNYRSTPQILEIAAKVIEKNDERMAKTVWSALPEGDKPRVISFQRDRDEAEWIAGELLDLQRKGYSLEDCAIFYRANWQSRIFEEALLSKNIPSQLVGSMRFYERREIRDLVAWLRLAVNPSDGSAFARAMQAPLRGVGEKSIASLVAYAEAHGMPVVQVCSQHAASLVRGKAKQEALGKIGNLVKNFAESADPLSKRVARLAKDSGLMEFHSEEEERIENIQEFINSISDWEDHNPKGTAAEYLAEVSLLGQTDETSGGGKGVFLMTVHNAKGLEFDTVFTTGLEEGIFPHYLSIDDPARLQEERRLFYVAATRAKKRLFLCHAASRYSFGREMNNEPSRFLDEFPPELVDWEEVDPKRSTSSAHWKNRLSEEKRTRPEHTNRPQTFSQGEKVRHREYGPGVILERSGEGKLVRLRVAFTDRVCTFIELYSGLESEEKR
ncbi:MAG TPA: 3'-5' exonuclease, partial [Spirochaetota bacterium]|nr:3'-5' exonuclease [Spirochaetota bacterium]